MKSLPRLQIDALVRDVEADAYGLARVVAPNADGDSLLLRAVAAEARSFPSATRPDLEQRLRRRIRSLAAQETAPRYQLRWTWRRAELAPPPPHASVAVPAALHVRLVDAVEELQDVEPTARRKTILLSLLVAGLVGVAVGAAWVRWDALAAARPTIRQASPAAGADAVPTRGALRISFDRSPADQPRLHVEPVDGVLGPTLWDGQTLIVPYLALHNDSHYTLVVDANFRSRFNDRGHFQTRWSFRTEGYAIIISPRPGDIEELMPRNGTFSINFDHAGDFEPNVTIEPADGRIEPGSWFGVSWTLKYAGLKASTRYRAVVVVDFGVPRANIRRAWTFTTEPGTPPTGVPVLWHSGNDPGNPSNPARMLALDWNGNLVGTMYQPVTVQSPDGSVVGTADGTYLEGSGARLSELSSTEFYPVIADDDQSVCELSATVGGRAMGQLWLLTGPLAGPLRAVAPMGSLGGSSGFGIIACSTLNDRAVIVYGGTGGQTIVKVIALSSGRVVFQPVSTVAVSNVVSSRDGRYLAEQMPVGRSLGAPSRTVIRRTADGAIVATIENQVVVRFSWDDQRVVAATAYQSGVPSEVSLIAWQSSHVLWTMSLTDGEGQPVVAWAEPNGSKMAVASSSRAGWPLDRLWLVDANGQATMVLSDRFYPASVNGS